jgi:hypothetical protein
MDAQAHGLIATTERRIDYEQDLVQGAIAMVSGGSSRRVTLAGLRFGEEILPVAIEAGRRSGVAVRPAWSLEDGRCDIIVEAGE